MLPRQFCKMFFDCHMIHRFVSSRAKACRTSDRGAFCIQIVTVRRLDFATNNCLNNRLDVALLNDIAIMRNDHNRRIISAAWMKQPKRS